LYDLKPWLPLKEELEALQALVPRTAPTLIERFQRLNHEARQRHNHEAVFVFSFQLLNGFNVTFPETPLDGL
jgi:hypothetical protein